MRRYRFRLEPVLRVRRIQEELAKGELVSARAEVARAEAHLEARLEHHRGLVPATAATPTSEFLAEHFRQEVTAEAVIDAIRQRNAARQAEADALAAWQEAAQRVQALERLDERHREDHALAAQRAEDQIVDDLVVSRFRAAEVHA